MYKFIFYIVPPFFGRHATDNQQKREEQSRQYAQLKIVTKGSGYKAHWLTDISLAPAQNICNTKIQKAFCLSSISTGKTAGLSDRDVIGTFKNHIN